MQIDKDGVKITDSEAKVIATHATLCCSLVVEVRGQSVEEMVWNDQKSGQQKKQTYVRLSGERVGNGAHITMDWFPPRGFTGTVEKLPVGRGDIVIASITQMKVERGNVTARVDHLEPIHSPATPPPTDYNLGAPSAQPPSKPGAAVKP